ncbi:MAG: UDP-N-acetylglucosamine 2-epimerase (non-hydrolyzing) [Taibaiella sp.]|nr:UDP-N-acetylglucosamine 2-epimerase (non-hydrolyzing) [Taibaiella sp.]
MKKVIVFLGTRPEAIKLAPVIEAMKADGHFNTLVCSTGQHKEMLQQVLDFFKIKADFSLEVMEPNQQLAGLTAKLLVKINELLVAEKPDFIMVQGDTTTTMAASIAGFYNKIKILHVEAGLRTFNKFSPFPEEINRIITTRIADFHYPPTSQSRQNLLDEGIPTDKILVTGNTVIDALFLGLKKIEHSIPEGITALGLDGIKDFILVTMHRRENHGSGIQNICNAIKRISDDAQIPVIFPVHLNPNVKDVVHEILGDSPLIHLIPPAAYPEFLWLLDNSRLILTDSGGVQEEAPSLGKPVLLLRDTTERPEAMEAGTVLKVGSDTELIYNGAMNLLQDNDAYTAMATRSNPYGDGLAAQRIIDSMLTL